MWVAALAGLAGSGLAGLRWLRVAQREHYLAGSAGRFARRWWGATALNRWLLALALGALVASALLPFVGVLTAAVVVVGPLGLGLRGRTSALVWTSRLRRLAGLWAVLQLAGLAGSVILSVEVGGGSAGAVQSLGAFSPEGWLLGAFVLGVPFLVDLACWLASPLELRLLAPFVRRAAERLGAVGPVVVGITGSYGKTSTKGYVAHLVGASRSIFASPASYNNRGGLARAINEGLAPGTEVFVAEMGTYGPGEIAELCSWIPPEVAVITAIGPVHLERMHTEDAILAAKSEIFAGGAVAVLNVDDRRLAALAQPLTASGRKVWRCSAVDAAADVCVGEGGVMVRGERLCDPPAGTGSPGALPATNVACAVAVALELGVSSGEIARLIGSLPVAPNRASQTVGEGGFSIVDDTYNSNPAGAAMALGALAGAGSNGCRRVLVTPGMVELGARQRAENETLARSAAPVVSHLVVVGETNRRALLAGVGLGRRPATEASEVAGVRKVARAPGSPEELVEVLLAPTREAAVGWVCANLGPGDAVLYENDLPDHYP